MWRTSAGTRSSVTTREDSTGSVGESRAPSSSDSVHPRPDQRTRQQRHHDRRDRHADGEVAQGDLPVAPQQLALDLEAVAEQDHDQRRGRERRRRIPSSRGT